jgi:hypothetical protein
MKGITDDIISLPKIVKGMGYKCKLDGVDNGWEGLYQALDRKRFISDFPGPKTIMIPMKATPRDASIYI